MRQAGIEKVTDYNGASDVSSPRIELIGPMENRSASMTQMGIMRRIRRGGIGGIGGRQAQGCWATLGSELRPSGHGSSWLTSEAIWFQDPMASSIPDQAVSRHTRCPSPCGRSDTPVRRARCGTTEPVSQTENRSSSSVRMGTRIAAE
jgi:hypothetical protein